MSDFMNDFNYFLNMIIQSVDVFFEWLLSNPLGKILLFISLISIFIYIVNLIIGLKN